MLHQIGAGALGPVFRAYEPEQDRLVAVKLFKFDLSPERVEQLVADLETLIAADLTHPGISAPIAAGVSGGSVYLAQDFVAADSLDVVVRDSGPAAAADVVRVALQLAGALDLAASIDVTHGALHPRDVLMSSDDVRLTGLGLTRALERVGVAAPIRRPYTAPERAAGDSWDRRADLYSVAALVLELFTGRRIAGPGDLPSDALSSLAAAARPPLRRLFSRALAEDPADRFATAGDFATALQTALEPRPAVGGRAASGRRRIVEEKIPDEKIAEEPPVALPVFAPPPEELPLLTDEMLALDELFPAAEEVSAAADDAPPPIRESLPITLDFSLDDRDLREVPAELQLPGRDPEPDFEIPPPFVAQVFEGAEVEGKAPVPPVPVELLAAEDRAPTDVWPLVIALVVGLALGAPLGFGAAMWVIGRNQVSPASQEASASSARPAPVVVVDEPVRESTGRAVGDTAKPPAAAVIPPGRTSRPPASAAVQPPARGNAGSPASSGAPPPAAPRPAQQPTTAKPPAVARGVQPVARPSGGRAAAEQRTVEPPDTAKPAVASARGRSTSRGAASVPASSSTVKTGPGSLAVDSRPTGASVFVDGRLIGTTPLVMETMPPGEHAIHLAIEGYQRWASSFKIVPGERARVAASLEQ